MNTELIPVNQSLVRQLIADRAGLSLAELVGESGEELKRRMKLYWRALYESGKVKEWKVAITLAIEETNAARSFAFKCDGRSYSVLLSKSGDLTVRVVGADEPEYDDSAIGNEIALPGRWMECLENYLMDLAELRRREIERQKEREEVNTIVRLKG